MTEFHPLDYDRRRDCLLYRDVAYHRVIYTQERAKRAEADAVAHPGPELYARADQRHQEAYDAVESLRLWQGRVEYLDAVVDAVHELHTRAIDAETPPQILERLEREREDRERIYLIDAENRQGDRTAAEQIRATPDDPSFDDAILAARIHQGEVEARARRNAGFAESSQKRRKGLTSLDRIQERSEERGAELAQKAAQAQMKKMKNAAKRRVSEAARSRANRAKAKAPQ